MPFADLPRKHHGGNPGHGVATEELRELIASARDEVLLQTPYLVLSDSAQDLFRELQQRDAPPRVVVSTNSLAATDSFITYALSYKYKRRYLRDFAFEIHEFKPFPALAPIDPPVVRPMWHTTMSAPASAIAAASSSENT